MGRRSNRSVQQSVRLTEAKLRKAAESERDVSRPTFITSRPDLTPHEIPTPPDVERAALVHGNAYVRCYVLGECTVVVTRESDRWHLSVAHKTRLPTWDECAAAWYRCVPAAKTLCGSLVLPPLHEYVNRNEFCLQVCEIDERSYGFKDPEP